jgi:hypothetical protein
MTSSYFDYVSILRANNMKTSFLLTLFSLIYALENNIRLLGLINCYHFHFEVLTSIYHPRKGLLTNLTLEFGKVIRNDHSCNFFFNFTINPHFKALNMYTLARTFTFTRRNQKVIRSIVITEAKFTVSCNNFISFMNITELA